MSDLGDAYYAAFKLIVAIIIIVTVIVTASVTFVVTKWTTQPQTPITVPAEKEQQ